MSDSGPNASGPESQAEESLVENDPSEEASPQGSDAVCQNCGTPLAGEYCHECGKRHRPQLRLRDLGGRFLRSVLDVDELGPGLWRLFLNGANSPGTLTRQYVEGTRKRTVNPITYFLLASTLAFFVLGLFRAEWVQGQAEMWRGQWAAMGLSPEKMFGEGSPLREGFGWTSAEDMAQTMFAGLRQAQTYLSVLICLAVAGLLRWIFSGHSYAHLVVFELYTTAQINLLGMIVAPILMVWAPAAYSAASIVLLIGVHALAGPGFFGRNVRGWLLPPLAVAAFLAAIMVMSFIVAFMWALLAL